jgi:hypothetical protein
VNSIDCAVTRSQLEFHTFLARHRDERKLLQFALAALCPVLFVLSSVVGVSPGVCLLPACLWAMVFGLDFLLFPGTGFFTPSRRAVGSIIAIAGLLGLLDTLRVLAGL